ncbi:MAG: ABC transporter ATP-binding protein [Enterocloster asparagiformis]|nr:ABC transporter ATP-binding protein [Enterocloster asparagiformis]
MEELAVEMRDITKIFGGVKANDSIQFCLRAGSIHGLLGENGAGKTTLMNILYGLYRQEEGEILIRGQKQEISSPIKAISLGIGMVHQHFMLARSLTVVENVMLGRKSRRGILLDTRETADELSALAERYKMKVDPYAKVWQLSVGEQQRVEILTAIYQGAEILILDEPTAVLTPQETEVLFETLRHMKEDGKSIILITHKLEEIISIVDEVTVLRDGKLIGTRLAGPDMTKEELTRMMVGRDVLFNFTEPEREPGQVLLCLEGVCAKNDKDYPALTDFSLDIREGEVVGLAGVDGNGQKELCEVITGLRTADKGVLKMDGEAITNRPPVFYIKKGIAHIPEDRHTTGLALKWSLKKNLVLKAFGREPFSRRGFISEKTIDAFWEKARKEYQIKAVSGEEQARSLSGGNQQKVILARELAEHPRVVVANQPTRGLDIGASEYVRQKLLDARNEGCAVLLVSADLEEILQLSDRIAVIYDGRLMGVLPRGASVDEIGSLMMGKQKEANEHGK